MSKRVGMRRDNKLKPVAQTTAKMKGVYIMEKKFAEIINEGCKSGKTIEAINKVSNNPSSV